jgi:hypothetical protein
MQNVVFEISKRLDEDQDINQMKGSLQNYESVISGLDQILNDLKHHEDNDNKYIERLYQFIIDMSTKLNKDYDKLATDIKDMEGEKIIEPGDLMSVLTFHPVSDNTIMSDEFIRMIQSDDFYSDKIEIQDYYNSNSFFDAIKANYPNIEDEYLNKITDVIYK